MSCSKGCSDFIDTLHKCNQPFDLVPKILQMTKPPPNWVTKGKSEGHGIEARFLAHADAHMHATLDIVKKCGPPADQKKAQQALAFLSKVRKCAVPPHSINGVWVNRSAQASDYTVGSTVSLNCSLGFTLASGSTSMTCDKGLQWIPVGLYEDGSYVGSYPTCEGASPSCLHLDKGLPSTNCTDSAAINFSPGVETDDGSCKYTQDHLRDKERKAGATCHIFTNGTWPSGLTGGADAQRTITAPANSPWIVQGKSLCWGSNAHPKAQPIEYHFVGNTEADLTLRYVRVKSSNRTKGVGVRLSGAVGTLWAVIFDATNSAQYGGAIYAGEGSTLSVTMGVFSQTSALQGGAIFALSSTLTVSRSTFRATRAQTHGGGAIYAAKCPTVTISGSRFDGCIAEDEKGGTALFLVGCSQILISDSSFTPFDQIKTVYFDTSWLSTVGGCSEHPCATGYSCTYTQYSRNCTACPPSTVGTDGLACTFCAPGKEPNQARNGCVLCGPGMYSSFGIQCQLCEKPNVVSRNRTDCVLPFRCSAGTEPNTENAKCTKCKPGRYSRDGTACKVCKIPNVVQSDMSDCYPCKAGKGPNQNHTHCEHCERNEFSSFGICRSTCLTPSKVNADQTACVSGGGTGSYDAGKGVVRCFETDQAIDNDLVNQRSGRDPCPPCVDCEITNSSNGRMTLRSGYALRPTKPPTLSGQPTESIAIFKCPIEVACLASDNGTRCAEGYEGPLCGACANKYGKQKNHTCARCDSMTTKTQNRLELSIVFAVFIAIAFIWYKKASFGKMFRMALDAELLEHCKIVIGFFQVVSPLGDVLALPFAELMPELNAWLHSVDFLFINLSDFVAIDCIIPTFYVVWFCNVFVVPLVLFSLVGAQYWSQRDNESGNARKDAWTAGFIVLFLTYPRVSKHLFEIMVCRQLGDQQSVLEVNYSVSCETSAYDTFETIALIMVVFVPLGVPAWLLFRLINQRNKHEKEFADAREGGFTVPMHAQTHFAEYNYQRLLRSYGMVIRVYRAKVYYYEPFDWLRKMLLGGLLMLLHRGSILQVFVGTCVSFVYGMLHANLRPYRKSPTNLLKFCVELQIFLTLLISMLLRFADKLTLQSEKSLRKRGYEVLLLCSFVLLVPGAFFATTLVTLRHSRRERASKEAREIEMEGSLVASQGRMPVE
eukprot:SAG25_NODE_43_length_19261_cov_111.931218_9_plen_1166_part_00